MKICCNGLIPDTPLVLNISITNSEDPPLMTPSIYSLRRSYIFTAEVDLHIFHVYFYHAYKICMEEVMTFIYHLHIMSNDLVLMPDSNPRAITHSTSTTNNVNKNTSAEDGVPRSKKLLLFMGFYASGYRSNWRMMNPLASATLAAS
jgi:hypothetical protein